MANAAVSPAACNGGTISGSWSCRARTPSSTSCAGGLTRTGAIRAPSSRTVTETAPVAAEAAPSSQRIPVSKATTIAEASSVADTAALAETTTLPSAEVSLLHAAAELVACGRAIRTVPLEAVPHRVTAVGHPLTVCGIVLPSVADVPHPGAVDGPCPVDVDIDVAAAPAKAGPAPQRANKGDPAREGHAGQ